MQDFWGDTRTLLISGTILAGAVALALILHFVLFFLADRLSRRNGNRPEFSFTKRAKTPTRLIFPLLALISGVSSCR
jgi:hypothetical protein